MKLKNMTLVLGTLLLFSCKQGGGDSEPVQEEEAFTEEDFGSTSAPVKISGVNLTFENARAVCDATPKGEGKYSTTCYVAEVDQYGNYSTATSFQEGVTVNWEESAGVLRGSGEQQCSVLAEGLVFTCEVSTTSETAPLLEFSMGVSRGDENRVEKSQIDLAYSVESAAGLVPTLPFSYAPHSEALLESLKTGLALTGSEALIGNQQKLLGPKQTFFLPGTLSDVCYRGTEIFYGAGSAVYRFADGSSSVYAGSNRLGSSEDLTSRYRVSVGNWVRLACGKDYILIGDNTKQRILKAYDSGKVEVIVGGKGENEGYGYSPDGTPALEAKLFSISALALGPNEEIYWAETDVNRIRTLKEGKLYTVAGEGEAKISVYGISDIVSFNETDIFADKNSPISMLAGETAGSMKTSFYRHTNDRRIELNFKYGSNVDTCYFGKAIDKNSYKAVGLCDDHPLPEAFDGDTQIGRISSMAVGKDGAIYVANHQRHIIQKVSLDGSVSRIAGNGSLGNTGDGGKATEASLNRPSAIAVGKDDTLYVASFSKVRMISTEGIISTLAGSKDNDSEIIDDGKVEWSGSASGELLLDAQRNGNYYTFHEQADSSSIELTTLNGIAVSEEGQLALLDGVQLMRLENQKLDSLSRAFYFAYLPCGEEVDASSIPIPPLKDIVALKNGDFIFSAGNYLSQRIHQGDAFNALFKFKNHADGRKTISRLSACSPVDASWNATGFEGIAPQSDGSFLTRDSTKISGSWRGIAYQFNPAKKNSGIISEGISGPNTDVIEYMKVKNSLFPNSWPWCCDEGFHGSTINSGHGKNYFIQSKGYWQPEVKKYLFGFYLGQWIPAIGKSVEVYFHNPDDEVLGNGAEDPRMQDIYYSGKFIYQLAAHPSEDGLVYVADPFHSRIFKVKDGKATILVGKKDGSRGNSSDGSILGHLDEQGNQVDGEALIDTPVDLAIANNGDVYFVDYHNQKIRTLKKQSDGNYALSTFLDFQSQNDCSTGVIKDAAVSEGELQKSVSASVSKMCRGVLRRIAIHDTCGLEADGKTTIAYSQLFDNTYSNIVLATVGCSSAK